MPGDAVLESGAFADEQGAAAQELTPLTSVGIREPDRRKQIDPEEFGEFARVDRIGLGPRLPNELHVKRVGDACRVPMLRKPSGQPLPVQRRFPPDRHRPWERAEPPKHGLERRGELAYLGDDLTSVIEGARGDVALVKIESDERHDCLPHRLR